MVKEFAPKLRRMEPILSIDLEDAMDVWIPPLEHFKGGIGFDRYQNFFKEIKKKGKEVWFYACFSPRGSYPNRFPDFPLLKQRSLSNKNPELAKEIVDSVLPSITVYERRIKEFNIAWKRLVKALS